MEYARRSMQRLGFLKWLLTLASASRTQSLESLTRTFHAAITKHVPIPDDKRQSFEEYLQLRERRTGDTSYAQRQDLYLSDPEMPSRSGAITGDLERAGYRHAVYVEVPTWAARLRFLRAQNYTLTDRGRVVLLCGDSNSTEPSPASSTNPLLLTLPERYVFMYCLLDADGDFLAAMFRRLLSKEIFARVDAATAALEALEELRSTRLKHVSAGRLLELRLKMDKTISAMRNQRQGGGLGPRESVATPRTEPLVDCGILSKPQADKYEYNFSTWGRTFLEELTSVDSVTHFLENGLSHGFASLTCQRVNNGLPELRIVEHAYTDLRSGLGYVSLRELSLLTVAQLLYSPAYSLVEIARVEDALKRASSESGRMVRLALGRSGGIAQVRIDKRSFMP